MTKSIITFFCNPIGGAHIHAPCTKIAQEFPDPPFPRVWRARLARNSRCPGIPGLSGPTMTVFFSCVMYLWCIMRAKQPVRGLLACHTLCVLCVPIHVHVYTCTLYLHNIFIHRVTLRIIRSLLHSTLPLVMDRGSICLITLWCMVLRSALLITLLN